jgi:hypothetical protein
MAQRRAGATQRRGARARLWLPGGLLPASLCALLLCLSPSAAQLPDRPVKTEYCRWRDFNIPFDASDPRVAKIHLYVSEDGRSWTYRATAEPAKGNRWFEFPAARDGWYFFAVQTADINGQLNPVRVDTQTPPSLKVCVDTVRPKVTLQAITAPSGQVGVSWVVQDENLNNLRQEKPGTLLLEYRAAGSQANWMTLSPEPKAVGQAFWPVSTNAPLEVHLRATDDAGNQGEATTTITPGAAAGSPLTGGGDPGAGHVLAPKRQFTNSKKVNLKYSLQDVGKSGVSVVEVWFTTDGRSWQLRKPWKDFPKELDKPLAIPLTFDDEGLYGFTLVPRSGVGRGAPGPQAGDDAQIWIEYDTTPPVVRLSAVEVGRGEDEGKLLISWSAQDKNLDRADRSITLSYAEDLKGSWTAFAKDIPNDGFYSWKMDATVPFQFYVRVEARDKANNVGKADSVDRIKVDLNQPKANISGIEVRPEGP